MSGVEHVAARTAHTRRGDLRNAFAYGIDYVLVDAEAEIVGPALFGRNRAALVSLHDADHGGDRGRGRGAAWLRETLAAWDIDHIAHRIELLAQPRVLGHVFNPVSFWFVRDAEDALRLVVAEVTNTYGDRHAYLCHREDLGPVGRGDVLSARKLMHVSPFQDVAGEYTFRFDIGRDAIDIAIDYRSAAGEGVTADLRGPRASLTDRAIVIALLKRPFGARRVLALIHWQALKLWWKGARFRPRPAPPAQDISARDRGPDAFSDTLHGTKARPRR